jgi:CBS domain-containing protein
MKIARIMTKDVRACNGSNTLARAAQLMWDHDIGAVPVVDDNGRVIGMITDRDACMAAYTRGQPLAEILVADAMSTDVVTCREDAGDSDVARLMANAKIHRLPVVDTDRKLIGIVSLNDLALAMRRSPDVTAFEVAETLASVCEPRRSTFATA